MKIGNREPTPLGNKVLMYTLQIIKRKREERKVKKRQGTPLSKQFDVAGIDTRG